jgi:hypothetical protein
MRLSICLFGDEEDVCTVQRRWRDEKKECYVVCGIFCCLRAQFERTTTNDDTRKNATPEEKEQGPYGVTLQQTTEGLPCPYAALPCFNGNSNQGTQPTQHMKQESRALVFTNPSPLHKDILDGASHR